MVNYHNDDGECKSCTRCAKIHGSLSEMNEVNEPLWERYWVGQRLGQKISATLIVMGDSSLYPPNGALSLPTPYSSDAGDETE